MTTEPGVPRRRVVEMLGLAGAVVAAIAGQVTGTGLIVALALAAGAAIALGLMLHGVGFRLVWWVLLLLAVVGVVVTIEVGGWAYLATAGFVAILVASRVANRFAPSWALNREHSPTAVSTSEWKQQDLGIDTTDDVPHEKDSR